MYKKQNHHFTAFIKLEIQEDQTALKVCLLFLLTEFDKGSLDCRLADLPFPPIVVKFHTLTSNTLNLYDLLVFIIHMKHKCCMALLNAVSQSREKERRESLFYCIRLILLSCMVCRI